MSGRKLGGRGGGAPLGGSQRNHPYGNDDDRIAGGTGVHLRRGEFGDDTRPGDAGNGPFVGSPVDVALPADLYLACRSTLQRGFEMLRGISGGDGLRAARRDALGGGGPDFSRLAAAGTIRGGDKSQRHLRGVVRAVAPMN